MPWPALTWRCDSDAARAAARNFSSSSFSTFSVNAFASFPVCNFLTFFWNQTHFVRHDAQCYVNDLFGVAHFEIQFRHDVGAQPFDVALLNMAAIRPQMGDNSAGTSLLANTRRHQWI